MVKTFNLEHLLHPAGGFYWIRLIIPAQNIRALLWEGMTHG